MPYSPETLARRRAYNRQYFADRRDEVNAKHRAKYQKKPRVRVPIEELSAKQANFRRWYDKHREEIRAKRKAQYHENGQGKAYVRERRRIVQELASTFPKPKQCEVCGSDKDRIEFDHCHQRGIFRGWICGRCNKVLGQVRDDPNHLRKLIAYLERTKDLAAPIANQLTLPV